MAEGSKKIEPNNTISISFVLDFAGYRVAGLEAQRVMIEGLPAGTIEYETTLEGVRLKFIPDEKDAV